LGFDNEQISKSLALALKLPKITLKGNPSLTIENLWLAIDLRYIIVLNLVSVEIYKARFKIF